ncbi:MAG: hypothetical protein ACFFD1_07905, partial [Candidatus Thorarchaeota archaeon]
MTLHQKIKETIVSNIRLNKIIYLIIALNLILILPLAYNLTVGIDEAYSLNTTSKDIFYAFKTAISFENQPPFYFVSLTIWRFFSDSFFWARLFSVFNISLMIYVSALFSRKFIPHINPGWICVIIAFNPFVVWAAIELRGYALTLLLSAFLLLYFYKAYLSDKPDRKARIIYIIFSVVALNTYYYLGFILVANAIVLLVFRQWKSIRKYIVDLIIPACSLIYLIPWIPYQITYQTDTQDKLLHFRGSLEFIFYRIEDYLFSRRGFYVYSYKDVLFDSVLIGFTFLILRKNLKNFVHNFVLNPRGYLPGIITLLSFIFILCQVTSKEFIMPRHTSFLFIPLIFTVYYFLASKPKLIILISWSVFILSLYSLSLFERYNTMEKNEDAKNIATYIMNNETKNQPILIFRNEIALPFQVHYKGKNQVIPIPRPINFEEPYDHKLWILHNESEIKRIFAQHIDSKYFWLLTVKNEVVYGVNYHAEILENFISKNFVTIDE